MGMIGERLLLLRALLGVAGFAVFIARMRTALRPYSGPGHSKDLRLDVSLIIPARNEAQNLPALLRSIRALCPAPREVIVVDDHSTDATAEIARAFGARVISPNDLPAGCVGKPWACAAGAAVATSPLLLFTDADTVHAPDSMGRAVAALEREGADLVSVLPTHVAVAVWERLQGIFQLLLLVATRAGARPDRDERCFCIGQYLLVRRAAYDCIGGHVAVQHRVAEDLAMARLIEERGLRFFLLRAPGMLRVRMYPEGLRAFVQGWRRNFREGMRAAGPMGVLETVLVMTWLLDVPRLSLEMVLARQPFLSAIAGCAAALSVFAIAYWQRQVGAFRASSAFAYPAFALLFVWVSCLSLADRMLRRPVTWKGRTVIASALRTD
jgi:4,4'-diaponeurosporenoate glycosyltransferase